ncbi:MAG: hypothetical protein Kow00121_15660 [Elainellaceae cyanobacterium]
MQRSLFFTAFVSATIFAVSTTAAIAQIPLMRRSQPIRVAPTEPEPPNHQTQLAAPDAGDGHAIVTTCSGASSCNDFIALCAASGGEFTGTKHDGQGRPIEGECEN